MVNTLVHLIEAGLLTLLLAAFRILPLDAASWAGGFLGRAIGPYLRAHRTAAKNLGQVFPEKSEAERQQILTGMWNNLGRVAAELPHLSEKTLMDRITIHGVEHIPAPDVPAMLVSGHLGNWEILPPLAARHGMRVALVYRHANNHFVDAIIARIRSAGVARLIPKGPQGAVKIVRAIKSGESLAMLVDQKMSFGIAVPFFGRPAMTAPAVAELALRYNMPLIMVRVVRKAGAHFDVTVDPPLAYAKTGDDAADALAVMTAINRRLEAWIREHPEQWFWVHKRWGD